MVDERDYVGICVDCKLVRSCHVGARASDDENTAKRHRKHIAEFCADVAKDPKLVLDRMETEEVRRRLDACRHPIHDCDNILEKEMLALQTVLGFMETIVVNMRESEQYDVRIDRATKWGNPFRVGPDGTRDEVIAKYRNWITVGEGNQLLSHLEELRGKRLGCWCKPLACHGDVLIELLEGNKI